MMVVLAVLYGLPEASEDFWVELEALRLDFPEEAIPPVFDLLESLGAAHGLVDGLEVVAYFFHELCPEFELGTRPSVHVGVFV